MAEPPEDNIQPRFQRALVTMVKAPVPGRCKTRLCPPLSPELAADLYRAFLHDIARELSQWDGGCDLWVAWSAEDEELPADLQRIFSGPFRFLKQRGEDLTTRMEGVFERLLSSGYRQVLMRNSDSPQLPMKLLERAFRQLEDGPNRLVLGPDLDGGYYLIGLDRLPRGMLPATLSHDQVLEQTRAAAGRAGMTVVELERWLDVDTPDDLTTFWLEFSRQTAVRDWATRELLEHSPILELLRNFR